MHTFAEKAKATQQTTPAKSKAYGRTHFGQSHEMSSNVHLQRMIGNQAVQRLLEKNAEGHNAGLTGLASPHFRHDFCQIPIHPADEGAIQTKLAVNTPGDKYEQEADNVAEQVMRMPESAFSHSNSTSVIAHAPTRSLSMQSLCSACEGEILRRREESQSNSTTPLVNRVESTLRQTGRPLDPSVRNFFEPRFGIDFGNVRIHTDVNAALSASEVNARAYTVGRDIVFNTGQYAPQTHAGRFLLAHELTHVAQQSFSTGIHLRRLKTGHGSRRDDYGATKSATRSEMDTSTKRSGADSGQGLPILGGLGSGLSLTPSPVTIARAIETYCLAPSEVPSITSNQASSFGMIAEIPIVWDYCTATGGCALMVTDYIDTDAASYIAFLAAKNPHLTTQDIIELAIAATVTGGVSRPDVLTHKPPRFEFEEVKPDSVTGRLAGRLKLLSLATLFARFSLPYLPGATWPGTGTLPLFTLPGGVTVFLEWHRNLPGLVVYNLCVRGEASVLAAYGILAILIAAILILLTRGQILRGAPTPLPIPLLASAETPDAASRSRGGNEAPAAQGGRTELA